MELSILRAWVFQIPKRFIATLSGKRIVNFAVNALRPKQNDRHFADGVLKTIYGMVLGLFSLKFHWDLFPVV